jgi:CheY-like chemotaxis protein
MIIGLINRYPLTNRQCLSNGFIRVSSEPDKGTRFTIHLPIVPGAVVLPCSTADEALATCQTQHVDVLLTDVVMPDVGGEELATRLGALRPDIPVLFMSGYMGDPLERDRFAGRRLIQKPFTAAELAAKIDAALGVKRQVGA